MRANSFLGEPRPLGHLGDAFLFFTPAAQRFDAPHGFEAECIAEEAEGPRFAEESL